MDAAEKKLRDGVSYHEHIFFGSAGVKFIAYERNRFIDNNVQRIVGKKICLKIISVNKALPKNYGSFNSEEDAISLEIKNEDMQKIAGVLYGVVDTHTAKIARPNTSSKSVTLRRNNTGNYPYSITVSRDSQCFTTGFDAATAHAFLMTILYVLKLQYPGIDDQALLNSFVRLSVGIKS